MPDNTLIHDDSLISNSADGRFEGTVTKVIVRYDGTISWTPPASYKSACTIDVTFFPFDLQNCSMKFGSWTYDGSQVSSRYTNRLNHKDKTDKTSTANVSTFYDP